MKPIKPAAGRAWRRLDPVKRAGILRGNCADMHGGKIIMLSRRDWDALDQPTRDLFAVRLDQYLEIARSLGWLHRDSAQLLQEADAAFAKLGERLIA